MVATLAKAFDGERLPANIREVERGVVHFRYETYRLAHPVVDKSTHHRWPVRSAFQRGPGCGNVTGFHADESTGRSLSQVTVRAAKLA